MQGGAMGAIINVGVAKSAFQSVHVHFGAIFGE